MSLLENCLICDSETVLRDERGRPVCRDCSPFSLPPPKRHPHTFNRNALETINKSIEICNQRAGEYMDSWALENLRTPFTDSLANLDVKSNVLKKESLYSWAILKRLRIMAAMCDIKLSRLNGPFKEDTYVDMINYIGAFCGLRKEWEALPENKPKGSQC